MFYYISIVAITLLHLNNQVVIEHSATGPFNTLQECELYKIGMVQNLTGFDEIELRLSECRTNKPMV